MSSPPPAGCGVAGTRARPRLWCGQTLLCGVHVHVHVHVSVSVAVCACVSVWQVPISHIMTCEAAKRCEIGRQIVDCGVHT